MGQESLRDKTAKGLFWGGVSNGVQQLLNLLFGIFLARMLSQADYGMVGMLTIFSTIAASIQEGGFISALNRRKNITNADYNSVFWLCTSVSLCIYIILFFSAPLIASFYGEPKLVPLARVLFIGFFLSSLGIVPGAYIFRNMMVRQAAIITFVSQLLSGIVAVVMVYLGVAYWAIVIQTLVYIALVMLQRYYFSGWRPSLHIDMRPAKEMFAFGSKLMVTNVFTSVNNNLISVILGRLYTPKDVGNYTQANKWNFMGWSLINNMLGSIAQPVFARTDDDVERQKRIFRKLLRFTAFVSFPAMFGLALVSKEFIVLLLTDKWLESALMMQMLCVGGAFMPISSLFSNLIVSRGHSTTFMWCTIAQCVVLLLSVCLAVSYGINVMILMVVAVNVIWMMVWYALAHREISLSLREVLMDICPFMVISVVVMVTAWFATQSITNNILLLLARIGIASVLYLLLLKLAHAVILDECIQYLRKSS